MDPAHADKLREIALSVHDSLGARVHQYSDGTRRDAHLETMFRSHFPEIAAQIDHLASVRDRETPIKQRVMDKIAADTRARWTHDDGWNTGVIVSHAQAYVASDIDGGQPSGPHFSMGMSAIVQGPGGSGSVVRDLPIPTSKADLDCAEADIDELMQWVRAMHDLPVVTEWRESRVAQRQAGATLSDELERLAHNQRLSQTHCDEDCRAY